MDYTEAQRAEAVELYSEVGPTEVERQLGIPKGTVTRWAHAVGAEMRFLENANNASKATVIRWAEHRSQMVDDIARVAHKALARLDTTLDDDNDAKAKNYATTMAILVDKAQLLSGSATERHDYAARADELLGEAKRSAIALVPRSA